MATVGDGGLVATTTSPAPGVATPASTPSTAMMPIVSGGLPTLGAAASAGHAGGAAAGVPTPLLPWFTFPRRVPGGVLTTATTESAARAAREAAVVERGIPSSVIPPPFAAWSDASAATTTAAAMHASPTLSDAAVRSRLTTGGPLALPQVFFIPNADGVPIPVGRDGQPPLSYVDPLIAAMVRVPPGAAALRERQHAFEAHHAFSLKALEVLRLWFARHWLDHFLDHDSGLYLAVGCDQPVPMLAAWMSMEAKLNPLPPTSAFRRPARDPPRGLFHSLDMLVACAPGVWPADSVYRAAVSPTVPSSTKSTSAATSRGHDGGAFNASKRRRVMADPLQPDSIEAWVSDALFMYGAGVQYSLDLGSGDVLPVDPARQNATHISSSTPSKHGFVPPTWASQAVVAPRTANTVAAPAACTSITTAAAGTGCGGGDVVVKEEAGVGEGEEGRSVGRKSSRRPGRRALPSNGPNKLGGDEEEAVEGEVLGGGVGAAPPCHVYTFAVDGTVVEVDLTPPVAGMVHRLSDGTLVVRR